MRYLLIIFIVGLAFDSQAAEHSTWKDYIKANRYNCPGPLDTLAEPRIFEAGGKKYSQSGYRVDIEGGDEDSASRLEF